MIDPLQKYSRHQIDVVHARWQHIGSAHEGPQEDSFQEKMVSSHVHVFPVGIPTNGKISEQITGKLDPRQTRPRKESHFQRRWNVLQGYLFAYLIFLIY